MAFLQHQQVFYHFSIFSPKCDGKEIFTKIKTLLEEIVRSYIFQKEVIEIDLKNGMEEDEDYYVYSGKVDTGLNLEDEWAMTNFLLRVCEKFPNISVQVRDSDGEFMLLEIFEDCEWLTPMNSDNRIFLHKGHVQFIDLEMSKLVKSAVEGVKMITSKSATAPFETKLKKKMTFSQAKYTLRCFLPLELVHLIRKCPQMISCAVNKLEGMRVGRKSKTLHMERFKFISCVECMVSIPKMLFYLLHLQSDSLVPNEVVSGSKNESKEKGEDETEYAKILGFKLFLGLSLYYEGLSEDRKKEIEHTFGDLPTREEFVTGEKLRGNDKVEWPGNNVEANEEELQKISAEMVKNVKDWISENKDEMEKEREKEKEGEEGDVDEEMVKLMKEMDRELASMRDVTRVPEENVEEYMQKNFQMGLGLEKSMGMVGPSQGLFSEFKKGFFE